MPPLFLHITSNTIFIWKTKDYFTGSCRWCNNLQKNFNQIKKNYCNSFQNPYNINNK